MSRRDEIDANISFVLRRPGLCDTHQGYSYLNCLSSCLVPHPYLTVTSERQRHEQIETTNTLSSHSDEINQRTEWPSFVFTRIQKRSTCSTVQVRPAKTAVIRTAGPTSFSHDRGCLCPCDFIALAKQVFVASFTRIPMT